MLLLLCVLVKSKGIELSDSSQISLLTCSPGEELYSAFGHTGIRVTDYKNDFDVVFNYGTFDFDQPGFYTNFLKGKITSLLKSRKASMKTVRLKSASFKTQTSPIFSSLIASS